MSNTLVSFIGKGRKNSKSNAYDTTKYLFDDGKHIESSMFFDAILKHGGYDVSKAILIGTRSSTWSALIECALDKYEDLYLKIDEETGENGRGIKDSTLKNLEIALTDIWQIPIMCLAIDEIICKENAFKLIHTFFNCLSDVDTKGIIIDITHGFRSMPILLMSALQYAENINDEVKEIGILYGEFKDNVSHVRYLDAVWEQIKITRAANMFFQKFDANALADYLHPFWSKGANAISNLGISLQANYIIPIRKQLKQLDNALKMDLTNYPDWFPPIKKQITKLYNQLNNTKSNSQLCLCIADMFAERRIFGQALISLQLAFEAFVLEYNENDGNGDYEMTKDLRFYFIENNVQGKDKKGLNKLNSIRNMIAHGGSKSKYGASPIANNLPKQYESSRNLLLRIFKMKK
jgi:CRISPR-associated Csx2 family protein